MHFIDLAELLQLLEITSSRLEMTRILADFFKKTTPHELAIISNLVLGILRPPYQGNQFNFAEKNLFNVVADYLGVTEKYVIDQSKKIGDLGLVVMESNDHTSQQLTIVKVYNDLCDLQKISGLGSQDEKSSKIRSLLSACSNLEAKFIIRIILGTLRLGFSDMTLIDAFSWMESGNKSMRNVIEDAYNKCVDIGYIGSILKKDGINGLKKIDIEVGIPIRPAAAERMPNSQSIIEKLGPCVAQPKLDGFRIQIHLNFTKKVPNIKFFSRNLIDMSSMFPDLVSSFSDLQVKTLICEGEAISYDVDTGSFLPFQETVKRKRKHDIQNVMTEYPLRVFLFDLLYVDGESYLDKTHEQRRHKLKTILSTCKDEKIDLIPEVFIKTADQLEEYFIKNVEQGLEGLVVKRLDALYQPGKRNFNWIKLKRHQEGHLEDTIDCVVLGYYAGSGKRAAFGVGAFLVGVYNKKADIFQTIAKIGTGMKDDEWRQLKKKCDALKVREKPKNVDCAPELYPDVWVNPEIVCIIRADEITLSPLHTAFKSHQKNGYALRFPRFVQYRLDKKASEATTVDEVNRLYEDQFSSK